MVMQRSCQAPGRPLRARRGRAGSGADSRRLTGAADTGARYRTAGAARTTGGHRNDQAGTTGPGSPRPIVGSRTTGSAVPRARTAGAPVLPWAVTRAGAAVLPRSVAGSGASGSARVEHAVVMVAVVVVLPNEGADEEHRRDDEHDARDDHHPGRRRVEPRRLHPLRWWRRWRSDWGGWGRLGLRFGCLAHAMPYCPARHVLNRPPATKLL